MEGLDKAGLAKAAAVTGLFCMAGGGLWYAFGGGLALWGLGLGLLGIALLAGAWLWGRKVLAPMLGSRSFRLGLGSGAATLAALALVIFVGALAQRHHYRLDYSQRQAHTLAPQSQKVLAGLKAPVKALAFFLDGQPQAAQAKSILEMYAYASDRFSYQMVDPERSPVLAKKYGVSQTGAVVLLGAGKQEKIAKLDEQALTNALVRLLRPGRKTVYFVTGHGERGLKDQAKQGFAGLAKAVESRNYLVKPLILAARRKVPADAALVVLAGPKAVLLPAEKKALAAYLAGGGGLLMMMEPRQDAGLKDWLKARGVILGDDIVFDQASKLVGASPAWPIAASYAHHPITDPLAGYLSYFPVCRSVELAKPLPPGAQGAALVQFSDQSWAETDFAALGQGKAGFQPDKDRRGPITLAVALTLALDPKEPSKKAGLVVFGDADFASNAHLDQVGNRDLILNTVGFLAEEADLIAIRPKQRGPQTLLLRPGQAGLIFWVAVVGLPLVFVLLGVWVFLQRRRSR